MAFKDYRDLIRQMEREMHQYSDEAFRGFFTLPFGGSSRFWQPLVDIHETDEGLSVKMELAGSRAEDLQVSLSPDDRILTISGTRIEKTEDKQDRRRCHQIEIYFGPFERSLALPSDVHVDRDRITATYNEGFLIIHVPKRAPREPESRLIPITGARAESTTESGNE